MPDPPKKASPVILIVTTIPAAHALSNTVSNKKQCIIMSSFHYLHLSELE
jgi:hypothetical protein